MGKQFGFSMDNEDHEKFLQKIQENGDLSLALWKSYIVKQKYNPIWNCS